MHYTKGRVSTVSRFGSTSGSRSGAGARFAPWLLGAGLLVELLGAQPAQAQISPGGGGLNPGMSPSQQSATEDKKTGVAEAAPKTPGLLPTTPALPAPKGRRKRWKLLELD